MPCPSRDVFVPQALKPCPSTALRSGRDDKVVTVAELIFHGKKARHIATTLSSRPERSAVERSAVYFPGFHPGSKAPDVRRFSIRRRFFEEKNRTAPSKQAAKESQNSEI